MNYHRVPLSYPEKNKRERIPRSTWRKPMNSVPHQKVLQAKDNKYRRSPWVSKGSLKVEACNSKISYANVRWTYWDFTSSIMNMNIICLIRVYHNVHNLHDIYDYHYQTMYNHVHIVIVDSQCHIHRKWFLGAYEPYTSYKLTCQIQVWRLKNGKRNHLVFCRKRRSKGTTIFKVISEQYVKSEWAVVHTGLRVLLLLKLKRSNTTCQDQTSYYLTQR